MHRQMNAVEAVQQAEDDAAESTLIPQQDNPQRDERQLSLDLAEWAFRSSWAVNILLLLAKIVAFALSGSKAVLASLADSAVDLASQLVISLSEHLMKQKSDSYPIGRARLEALGVIGCACIMSMASLEVIQYSCMDLWDGFVSKSPTLIQAGLPMYLILGTGTAAKLVLYLYCKRFRGSDSIAALAEDHLNDVFSNVAAMVTASIAAHAHSYWWIDPIGAISISLVILWRWVDITWQQVKKIVGFTAPPEFIQEVETLAAAHSRLLRVDCIRAYHFGARFNVELEIILPRDMTVQESHDLSLELQHKIEAIDEVERAFVHVDYCQREVPEHKVERTLSQLDARKRRAHRGGADEQFAISLQEVPRQHLVTAV